MTKTYKITNQFTLQTAVTRYLKKAYNLKANEYLVLNAIVLFMSSDDFTCFPSQKTIADMVGIKKVDTIRAATNALIEKGLVSKRQRCDNSLVYTYTGPMEYTITSEEETNNGETKHEVSKGTEQQHIPDASEKDDVDDHVEQPKHDWVQDNVREEVESTQPTNGTEENGQLGAELRGLFEAKEDRKKVLLCVDKNEAEKLSERREEEPVGNIKQKETIAWELLGLREDLNMGSPW